MCARKRAELFLHVDNTAETPIYQQIYEQIRDAVMGGTVAEGEKLVSIRKLSADLGVSHTTVEQAYLQLSVEGLVTNVPRSGYVVAHVDTEYLSLARAAGAHGTDGGPDVDVVRDMDAFFAENRTGGGVRYDFSYANLQPGSFPAKLWRQLTDEVCYATTVPQLARYAYTDEVSALQEALCGHLARTRGVRCTAQQVVVQAGTDGALGTLLQLFDRGADAIGMEEPGYATVHEVARRHGFELRPLAVDQEIETFLAALDEQKPRLVFTTPSHQFPTGRLLPLDARTRLLKWAEENDAYIIEDDSCNEFRYATRPVPSLQSLDAYGRVIYLGNVSKVLSPALRVAYLVLPPKLLQRYWERFNYAHPPVSWLEQEVLARFISGGHWDAHARAVAKGNHRRHDELLHCLRGRMGDMLDISGADTGMHLYVGVNNGMSQDELLESALAQGAKVYGTGRMWFSKPPSERHVMVGFSAIALEDIEPGVDALTRAWGGLA